MPPWGNWLVATAMKLAGNPRAPMSKPFDKPNCVASARLNENCALPIKVGVKTWVASSTACR